MPDRAGWRTTGRWWSSSLRFRRRKVLGRRTMAGLISKIGLLDWGGPAGRGESEVDVTSDLPRVRGRTRDQ